MFWKRKPKSTHLSAGEAHILAQLVQVKRRHNEEQDILANILICVKRGEFKMIAYDHRINLLTEVGRSVCYPNIINDWAVGFLENLGYSVKAEQKGKVTFYTEYTIKW
jgi:hypothetical protein